MGHENNYLTFKTLVGTKCSWVTPLILPVGYVILVLIIALIVGLCVILYLLRRSSRVRFTDERDFKNTVYILYSFNALKAWPSVFPDILIWSPAASTCQLSEWTHWHLWSSAPWWLGCVLFHLNDTDLSKSVQSKVYVCVAVFAQSHQSSLTTWPQMTFHPPQ